MFSKKNVFVWVLSVVLLGILCFGFSTSFNEPEDTPFIRGAKLASGWVAETDIQFTGEGCSNGNVRTTYKGLPFLYRVNQTACEGTYSTTNKSAVTFNIVAILVLSSVITLLVAGYKGQASTKFKK